MTRLRLTIKRVAIYVVLLLMVMTTTITVKLSHIYYTEVRPYKADVEYTLANAEPEHRNLSMQMHTMIEADFYCKENPESKRIFNFNPNCGITKENQVARLLQHHFSVTNKSRSNLENNLHQMMLSCFIVRPLSQSEQNSLLSELTFFTPKAKSFNQFSKSYFKKPLSHLTLDETATLIAFTRAPSQYLRDSERLEQRQKVLLDRYELLKVQPNF